MNKTVGPIGIFDSGFGGLTIFSEIQKQLPQYDFIYLGDNARTPYGIRSLETVTQFTSESVEYLFSLNCPLIILACNTASAKALRNIQKLLLPKKYPDNRVLGVIRPTVEAIKDLSSTKTVALWATPGTIQSQSFVMELRKTSPALNIVQQACPMLVPLVEAGELQGDGLEYFIRKYWNETLRQEKNIDALLLGCTHYPILLPTIRKLAPLDIPILAQGDLVAKSLKNYLHRHPEIETRLTKNNGSRLLTTDQCEYFDELGHIFTGHEIKSERVELQGS